MSENMRDIVPAADPLDAAPVISVLLATHGRADTIGRALDSMAAQTLDPALFEVIVIVNGPSGDTPSVVADFSRAHPHVQLRVIESSKPGVAHARTLGLWAAHGEQMTILDDDDYVSPHYLQRLLDGIEPGVVPLVWLADIHEGAEDAPDFDNYYSTPLSELEPGSLISPVQLPAGLGLNVCKLIPVDLARQVGYDESLLGGSDFVFWAHVFARSQFRFRVPRDRDGVYYRTRGHGSLSRQDLSFDFNVRQRLACIASLEDIDTDLPEVQKVTARIVSAQFGKVNKFLRAHPEQRPEVIAAIEALRLRRLPWHRINNETAHDLALLYSFTPWNSTSGIVAARRVRERGVVVDVITQNLDNKRDRDLGATNIAGPFVAAQENLEGNASFGGWKQVRAYSEGVFETLENWRAEGRDIDYRSVYSRAMWAASHIAAAQYKLRNPQARWIAEFSDPLHRTILGDPRTAAMREGKIVAELRAGLVAAGFTPPSDLMLFEWAEHLAYALADEIVFTNENQQAYMLGYCPDPALVARVEQVARVAHHPTLSPEFYERDVCDYPLDPERVHFGYFGVFYATRGLTEVTEALARLSGEDRARVQLHVFTNKPEDIRDGVAAEGLNDVVKVNPYVPFLQYLNLTRNFDVLVVNDTATAALHDGINPYLPSKLSDYLGSGTPIWSISEPGSVLSKTDVAHRTTLADVDAAVEVFRSLAARRRGVGVPDPA